MSVLARSRTKTAAIKVFATLPDHLPISEAYSDGDYSGVWYSSQREHMESWFNTQATKGQGQYSRETPNRSAKTAYNRLLCDQALLWINEALGQKASKIKAAADAAKQEKDHRRRCAIIRKHLPWDEVAELAEKQLQPQKKVRPKQNKTPWFNIF